MSDEVMEMNLEGITSTQVLNRVNALLKIQDKHDELEEEMAKEIKAIQEKYQALYVPLYAKRSQVVNGEVEPTGDDIKPQEPIEMADLKSGTEKGIPEFWWMAMKNHSMFESIAMESGDIDEQVFPYLSDVTAQESAEGSSFSTVFTFAENPYFTNKQLTITVNVNEADMDLDGIDVTPIQWKEGKNFTVKRTEKTIKKKGPKGKAATVTKKMVDEKVPSLFNTLFTKHEMPSEETMEEDADDAGELQAQYQCAVILKETIIPNAVEWFLGRGQDEDEFGGEDGYDFDGMDEDDEDEDDDVPQVKPKSSKSAAAAAAPQPNNPECKQQ